MFSKDTIKTDIALLVTMLVGFFALFNIHLNADVIVQVANEIVDVLFVIIPLLLMVYHDLQHAKIKATVPLTTAVLQVSPPTANPAASAEPPQPPRAPTSVPAVVDPAATQPGSAI